MEIDQGTLNLYCEALEHYHQDLFLRDVILFVNLKRLAFGSRNLLVTYLKSGFNTEIT